VWLSFTQVGKLICSEYYIQELSVYTRYITDSCGGVFVLNTSDKLGGINVCSREQIAL